jgi:hypothetical protein
MDKWINTLRETLSASTVAVVPAPLRDCLEDAVFNQMIQYSPMPPKDRRRQAVEVTHQKREGVVVPLDEAEAIMLRMRPAEALMVLIALFTGMRWSELCAMRRRHLTVRPAQGGLPARGHYLIDPLEGAVHEDKHSAGSPVRPSPAMGASWTCRPSSSSCRSQSTRSAPQTGLAVAHPARLVGVRAGCVADRQPPGPAHKDRVAGPGKSARKDAASSMTCHQITWSPPHPSPSGMLSHA